MGGNNYRFDDSVNRETERIRKLIYETRGINLSKVQASKVLAWKSKNSSLTLTNKILLDIIGGRA